MTDALDGVREHYRTTGLTGHAVPDSSGEPPLITRAVSARRRRVAGGDGRRDHRAGPVPVDRSAWTKH